MTLVGTVAEHTAQSESTTTAALTPDAAPTATRYPSLDGFRGIAVAVIVLFHLYPRVAPGGAVGLSMFFTLSGFLITTVILVNAERNGRFVARQFWDARARRIMPAALAATAAISVLRVTTDLFPWTRRFDGVATLLQYNNWYFLFPSREDEEMLGQISGVRHMWSLAVEEQFYLAAAITTVVVAWFARDIRRALMWIAVVGMVASWALPALVQLPYDRIFFGTDTRSGEILAGVFLATLLYGRSPQWKSVLRIPLLVAGAVSLIALVYWTASADPYVVRDDRLVLPYLSAVSALCVVAGTLPGGPANVVLQTTAMRWLGLRSYGIYLYHQPLGFVVTKWLPDQSRVAHGITTIAVTCVVAELSYRFVEMPVRDRTVPTRLAVLVGVALVATIVACALVG